LLTAVLEMGAMSSPSQYQFKRQPPTNLADLLQLQNRISSLEQQWNAVNKFSSVGPSAGTTSAALGVGGYGASSNPDASVMMAELAAVKVRTKEMECLLGKRFEHRQENFGSPGEVETWLTKDSVPSSSMFWDLFSIMVCMKTKAKSGKVKADEKHWATRANLTQNEMNLFGSMSHLRPTCLFGSDATSEKVVDIKALNLEACPTRVKWIRDGEASFCEPSLPWSQIAFRRTFSTSFNNTI